MSSQNASQKEIDELDKKLLQERTKLEQLNGELIKTEKQTMGLDEANKKLNDTMKGLAIGIGAAFAALTKFAMDTSETADELKTLSSQTGLTTTEIQRLQYAANFVDVEFSTMSSSITKLEQNMSKARNGSKDLTDAFRKLHVRTTDNTGKFRDANEVFYEVIDALGKVKNETEMDTLAMELFGKSAKELKPLIESGSKALKEYGDEAERHSLIMSEDEVNAAASFNDSMQRLNASIDRIKQLLGEALMPILEGIADFLTQIDVKTLLVIGAVGGIIALVWKLVTAISAVTTVMAAQTGIQTVFNAVSLKTVAVILAICLAIGALIALIAMLTGKTEESKKGLEDMEQTSKRISENIKGATYSTNNVGRNAQGTDNWRGGTTWVGEEGPELVTLPRGSRITPARESAGYSNETNNYYITIDAKNVQDFNRVVELAQQQRMGLRRT
jgi:DNA repair exonuclease SbcCD ATPase subunit